MQARLNCLLRIKKNGQFSTDFNIIYDNSAQIEIYLIGSLMTNSTLGSYQLSKDFKLTGYNVLLNNNKKSTNEYMDVISKPKDEVD